MQVNRLEFRSFTEAAPSEGILKLKSSANSLQLIIEELNKKFPRLNFYKENGFLLDEEEGVIHIKIVDYDESSKSRVFRNGMEEIYSAYKSVFNELNIDFNK